MKETFVIQDAKFAVANEASAKSLLQTVHCHASIFGFGKGESGVCFVEVLIVEDLFTVRGISVGSRRVDGDFREVGVSKESRKFTETRSAIAV